MHADRDDAVAALGAAIAVAVRAAITQLWASETGPFCVYALVTVGEAFRPYLIVTRDGESRWDLADSPFAVYGDEHFASLDEVYQARGILSEMPESVADTEYWLRLDAMERALQLLDEEGFFGVGAERARSLLLVATMPPDDSDVRFATRLNPASDLLTDWLAEAAEGGT